MELWYSVAGMKPPLGVQVLVLWGGRAAFEAARVAHPETKREAWLVHDGRRPVFLPTREPPPDPKRPWAGWHTLRGPAPDYWRPKHPGQWRMPLPAPVQLDPAGVEGRMWSATQRFQAVEDAEAADLAREMEHCREAARAAGSHGGSGRLAERESEPPEKQFWLDPSLVTYSEPGTITPREAEGRIMRAIATERWVRVERPTCATFGGILHKLIKPDPLALGDLAAQDPAPVAFEPNGRDQDDMLIALSWLPLATPLRGAGRQRRLQGGRTVPEQAMVIRLRAAIPALSWRHIGKNMEVSHETARQLYATALANVHRVANGGQTELHERARRDLAAVRTANRAHRIRGAL